MGFNSSPITIFLALVDFDSSDSTDPFAYYAGLMGVKVFYLFLRISFKFFWFCRILTISTLFSVLNVLSILSAQIVLDSFESF